MTDPGDTHPVLQVFDTAEPQLPGIGITIIRQGSTDMADELGTIKKDGTYKNSAGDQFFYRAGHRLNKAQFDDLTLVDEGLPLTDLEQAMADRNAEAADVEPATRSKGAAPENRSK